VSLILDAGALVAVERGDRDTVALIKHELLAGRAPLTHGGVIGHVEPASSSRRREPPMSSTPRSYCWRRTGTPLLTSDPSDIAALAAAVGVHVDVVRV
jgi:hypothetical protein